MDIKQQQRTTLGEAELKEPLKPMTVNVEVYGHNPVTNKHISLSEVKPVETPAEAFSFALNTLEVFKHMSNSTVNVTNIIVRVERHFGCDRATASDFALERPC